MTTVEAASWKALNHLSGQFDQQFDVLNGSINDSVTTLELTHDIWSLAPGDWIEIDTEPMQVLSKDGLQVTVLRGAQGQTAASHSDLAVINIKPWFMRHKIVSFLKDEILSLPRAVYAENTVDVAFTTNSPYVELDVTSGSPPLTVLAAYRDPSTSGYDPFKTVPLKLIPNDQVSSGWAVQTSPTPLYFSKATTVRVTYAYEFDTSTFADATDLETTVGLSSQLVAAIEFGAASRAMMGLASARTQLDTQGTARDSEEVPGGLAQQQANNLQRTRNTLIAAETSRLRQKYGVKVE